MWPCSLLPRTPTSNLSKGEQPYWVFKARAFFLWDEPEPLIPAWLLPKAPGRQHACRGGCEPNPRGSFINLCPTSYLVSNISTSASSKPVSRDDLGVRDDFGFAFYRLPPLSFPSGSTHFSPSHPRSPPFLPSQSLF